MPRVVLCAVSEVVSSRKTRFLSAQTRELFFAGPSVKLNTMDSGIKLGQRMNNSSHKDSKQFSAKTVDTMNPTSNSDAATASGGSETVIAQASSSSSTAAEIVIADGGGDEIISDDDDDIGSSSDSTMEDDSGGGGEVS